MKVVIYIGCLIAAALVWFIGGLIAWNIVCSFIDVEHIPLLMLDNYRIATYSGIAIIASWLILSAIAAKFEVYLNITVMLIIAGIIACAINYWENIWDSVALILTILYNIFNILIISSGFYVLVVKD